MNNTVDSSAWVEYFIDGPNAAFFAPAIENTASLVVPSISLPEVFRSTLQPAGEGLTLEGTGVRVPVVDIFAELDRFGVQ